ncbi:MAG: nitroreductase family protein [Verrucomicrobia bacterium]|nr:MAG: nitroreductase family protein [Verrucomicrobiota bacterium]
MDTLEAIFTRRSIRKYTTEPVGEDVVHLLLRAAMVAPSAADQRPWHFVVVRDRGKLQAMGRRMEGCEMLDTAALGILVCGDESLEKVKGFWVQDCSACAMTILLAAHAKGLGAVWVAVYPLEERMRVVREELGIPANIIPFALVSMGHPDEHLPGEDRFDASRVHREQW